MKIQILRHTLFLASACALAGLLGCGTPPAEEATSRVSQRQQALSAGPDFLVREVSAPVSTGSNGPLRVQVRVCNQGLDGASTNLEVYLSSDAEVSTQDVLIGSTILGWLQPGRCQTETLYTSASVPDGAWYVGAIADSYNGTQESDETNNTRVGRQVGVGYQPDIVVEKVSLPASIIPGQTFPATVKVCNQGTTYGSTEVQLVLSEDDDIRFSFNGPPEEQDLPVFYFYSQWLNPGQCATETWQIVVNPPQEGAWYLGAVADPGEYLPELIETNNTRASELFGAGFGPDFVIREVSGPASVSPGQYFTTTVKVCNQGTADGATEVQLVLSEDADIQFSYDGPPEQQDLPISIFYTGWLGAGQCATQQVQSYAYVPHDGPWYLGALADPGHYYPELIETNNTRASELVGLGFQTDYVIREVSGPASVTPGQPFTATVKVCNQGTVSGSTDVRLVLSEDTDIFFSFADPRSDAFAGSVNVGPLSPGQCVTRQVDAYAQAPAYGAWYLGAVADSENDEQELIETNNTRASSEPMGVGYEADFIIKTVTTPSSVMPGQAFTAKVTMCNQGTSDGYTDAVLVLSEDADIQFSYGDPTSDPQIGWIPQEYLAPGQCVTRQVEASPWAQSNGTWYVGAVANPDGAWPELISTNNTRAGGPMGIGHRSDIYIREVNGPVNVAPGELYTLKTTVCNGGTVPAFPEVQLVLSEDTDIQFSYDGPPAGQDIPVGYFYVPGLLNPGQCVTRQVQTAEFPPHEGLWYLGAVADPGNYEEEFREDNNTGASAPTGFGYRNDYVLREVSGPASVMPGQTFTATVKVCNQGTTHGGTDVMLVLSEDTDIQFSFNGPPEQQDLPLDGFFSGPLDAGQCVTRQVQTNAYIPHDGVWYLGAVADPGQSDEELNETNNTLAGGPIGFGFQTDYVIREVSAPPSVMPWQPSFPVSVKVCNQGTQSGNTHVQLVLSADSDIHFSYNGPPYGQDLPAGDFNSGWLDPGQCVTQQVQVNAQPPQEGAWYVGAVADAFDYEQEFLENNNTGVSAPVGFGNRTDYVITSVSGPASVAPGQPYTATVKVCNQGTIEGSTDVYLLLSEDADIQFSFENPPYEQDLLVDNFTTGWLNPGQCVTKQVQLNSQPPQEGTWYLGAVADLGNSEQEFREDNNTGVSAPVGFGYRNDYVIREVSTPASVAPGQPFTASVKVCNQGTSDGGTDVTLVLSEDADIHFSFNGPPYGQDWPLDSFFTGWLAAGQCVTRQVQTYAYAPHEGAWYLGAVADPGNYEQEFREDNNTGASAPFGIGYQNDYVIRGVSGPVSVVPGQPYTASVKVCNQGTTNGSTEVMLVLSADTDIQFSFNGPPYGQDWPVDSFFTNALEAGQCETKQVQIGNSPPLDGLWYLGAVADPGNYEQELLEGNNTRASNAIGFGFQIDYVVQEVSGPVSVAPGQPYTASVKVCNQGTVGGGTDVMLVLSEDADIRFSFDGPPYEQDILVDGFFTDWLEAGQCVTKQVQLGYSPPLDGLWYLGAVADPYGNDQEFSESNNSRASHAIGFGNQVDYIVESVSGPVSVAPGQTFTASVKVCNQGTQSGNTDVQLVFSEDSDIHFSYNGPPYEQDLPLEIVSTGWLEAGQCVTKQVQLGYSPPNEGLGYLGAVVDPGNNEPEFFEDNNTRASEPIGFGYRTDYVIREVRVPASVAPGQLYTASVKVCNQGTADGGTDVQLVLSADTDIQFSFDGPPYAQDLPTETFFTGPLSAGRCVTKQVELGYQPPQEGVWYVGAIADPNHFDQEFREDNNTRASAPVGFGYMTDYVIQEVSGPASVIPGQPFTATVKVCNQGTLDGGTDVQLVLSADTDIQFSYNGPQYAQDWPLDSFFTGWLAAGQCMTKQVQTSASVPQEGLWHLGAIADPSQNEFEFREDNNSRASEPMGVGNQLDFVIRELSGPTNVTPGQPFTASVKVCNQGSIDGETDVQLVLSEDSDIHFSYNDPPYEQDIPVDSFLTGWLAAGQCVTKQVQLGGYQPPHDGLWYLGAVADPSLSAPEFREDNNTRASATIGFGFQADYVIQAVSGPPSVAPAQPFIATVKVCNQGTSDGGTDVTLVLSEDADIQFSFNGPSQDQDLPLESFFTGPLAARQCVTKQVDLYNHQPPHDGLWYLGAVADPGNSEPEFLETNNSLAGGPMGIGYEPDLTIQKVSGPHSVSPWDPFTAAVTVCNQGSMPAFADVELVLSEDTDIQTNFGPWPGSQDHYLDYFSLPQPLQPGQCKTHSVQLSAPVPHEGIWYLGAIVDPASSQQEFREDNNSRASEPLGLGSQEDFVIESVSGPPGVMPWEPFTASVKVCNHGTLPGGTEVQLVFSADQDIRYSWSGPPSGQDEALTSFYSGMLEPGQCTTQQVQANAYAPYNGAWYLGAVADPGGSAYEFFENNNSRAGTLMGVGVQEDYVIAEVSGPASADFNTPFMASVKVCNQGTYMGSGAEVVLVFSEDTDIRFSYYGSTEGQDAWAGNFITDPLAPGECTTQQVQAHGWYAPHDGLWHLGAVVDPGDWSPELIETNNSGAGTAIGLGYRADLVIEEVSGPASVQPGAPLSATVKVCNQGTSMGGAEVIVLLSDDTDIRYTPYSPYGQDQYLDSFFSGWLQPGQCMTQQVQPYAYPPSEGTWYVGALVDPYNYEYEFRENNNTRASEPVGIGNAPDLRIESVSAPASVAAGQPYDVDVTVCNQGTTGAPAEVLLVLSDDTDIRFSNAGPPMGQDLPLESLSFSSLSPGQCVNQTVTLTVQPPASGHWYVGAVADPGDSLLELIELNNTRPSGVISFGP